MKHKRQMSADNNDPTTTVTITTSSSTTISSATAPPPKSATIEEDESGSINVEIEDDTIAVPLDTSDNTKAVIKEGDESDVTAIDDLEGDENADEIELRVDDMKTPKGIDSGVSEGGKDAIKRLFKVNSKEDKSKKGKNKNKTKSNSELSTADTPSAETSTNKAKKSSSNRSINRNNSGKGAGYNIFNFLFHSPTEK